jgi:hypothetical protein
MPCYSGIPVPARQGAPDASQQLLLLANESREISHMSATAAAHAGHGHDEHEVDFDEHYGQATSGKLGM